MGTILSMLNAWSASVLAVTVKPTLVSHARSLAMLVVKLVSLAITRLESNAKKIYACARTALAQLA
jgi:hypothetical protein